MVTLVRCILSVLLSLGSCLQVSTLQLLNGTITVDRNGTQMFYTDTGPPSKGVYTTVIAVHGQGFDQGVFNKMQSISKGANVRFVAVNRRDYPGSTPWSTAELNVIKNGTDDQKTQFLSNVGVQLLTFIDIFTQTNNLPPPTSIGAGGGIILVGWSLGTAFSVAAAANINKVAPAMQARLASHIHTFMMHEPSTNIIGLPLLPGNWVPWNVIDPTIPPSVQFPFFAHWCSGYFQHGDLSSRDPSILSIFVPGIVRPPTVFNMTQAQFDSIVQTNHAPLNDISFQLNLLPQLLASYNKANFDNATRALLPMMKNFFIGGEHSPAFGPFAVWSVQDDDKAHGGGFIEAKIVPGINHISPWDEPVVTLQQYLAAFHRTF